MNFSKYKRVFAFGCSFTNYVYPTWANLLFHESVNAKCYNFGKPGMGNLAISSRIAEANTRFKFNEDDLVIVMYTTMFREDRWLHEQWQSHGNVYNQPFYDQNFVKKYVDPIGCMIRDLSVVELSSSYVRNTPCDSLFLKSSDLKDECDFVEEDNPIVYRKLIDLYSPLWDGFPKSLKETLFPNGWVTRSVKKSQGQVVNDSHPITTDYYHYLTSIGVDLSERTYQYALEADRKLNLYEDYNEWVNYFPEVRDSDATSKVF